MKSVILQLWDCQPHPWDEVVANAMTLVPPTIAIRAAEDRRKRTAVQTNRELKPRQRGDTASNILAGQRIRVVEAIVAQSRKNVTKFASRIDVDGKRVLWMVPVGDGPVEDESIPEALLRVGRDPFAVDELVSS